MTDLETYPGFKDAEMKSPYTPIGANILTKQNSGEQKNDYGLIMTIGDQAHNRPDVAIVESVGDDVIDVNIGDVVFFSRYAGVRINVDNEDYLLLSRGEIFGFNPDKLEIKMGETKDLLGIMENVGKMIEGD